MAWDREHGEARIAALPKKAAVTKALQVFIARRRQKRLFELMGQLEWDEGFDYKAERSSG
jgi:hypothetical protein